MSAIRAHSKIGPAHLLAVHFDEACGHETGARLLHREDPSLGRRSPARAHDHHAISRLDRHLRRVLGFKV
eukprot:3158186-Pleurochrysis_carterae.AAC.1